MMLVAMVLLLVGMVLLLARGLKGPTMYDRILVANGFGTKTVVLIVLISVVAQDTMFLDIALVYALINFITTIGLLKYFTLRSLGEE